MSFNQEIINTVILGGILFLLLVFIIIWAAIQYHNSKKEKGQLQLAFEQELLKTQLETQEQTFHQIGEELHDNIGQLLSSTHMLIAITERSLDIVPDTLKTASQTLGKAIQDLRMLSKSLNKEWLNQFNVLDNLAAEIDRINASRTIHVTLQSSVSSVPLEPEFRVMLFRIIQEALHNAMKHSEAQNVSVEISNHDTIKVLIRDDGKGFQTNATELSGIGLLNMNHRTTLLGGKISWTSLPGQGTEVTILIPAQNSDT